MIKEIKISQEESMYVEKAYYLYTSIRSLLKYFAENNINDLKTLDYYNTILDKRFTELEMIKSSITTRLAAENNLSKNYSYSFDFETCVVTFTLEDGEQK